MRAPLLVPMVLLALAGCGDDLVFECTTNKQCVRAGQNGGMCVGTGDGTKYCAFKDAVCPSGLKYDATAGRVAGQCTGGGDLGLIEDMTMAEQDLLPGPPDLSGPAVKLTWNPVNSAVAGNIWCVGGSDDNHVWVGGPNGIWFSGDDGKTFNQQPLPGGAGDITGIYAVGESAWAVNHESQIFYRADDKTGWQPQSTPMSAVGSRLFSIWGSGREDIYISGDAGLVMHSSNGGPWQAQFLMGGVIGYFNTIWGSSGMDVWASGGSGVDGTNSPMAHTTNGGQKWTVGTLPSDLIIFRIWGSGPDDIYVTGEQQVVYHSSGGGFARIRQPTGSFNDSFNGIWGSGRDDVYLCGSSGRLLRTTDVGMTWEDQATHTSAELTAIWGSRKNNVYVVGADGLILHGTP